MGRSFDSITACYATGDVSSSAATSAYAGGLVGSGSSSSSITACYATGDVSSTSTSTSFPSYAGGLVGISGGHHNRELLRQRSNHHRRDEHNGHADHSRPARPHRRHGHLRNMDTTGAR